MEMQCRTFSTSKYGETTEQEGALRLWEER